MKYVCIDMLGVKWDRKVFWGYDLLFGVLLVK